LNYGPSRILIPGRQEHHPQAKHRWQIDPIPSRLLSCERVWNLCEQAGAIAAAAIGVHATPVCQPAERLECALYGLMRAGMPKPCDEADTTCIMVDGELIARHPSCVSSTDLESTIENFDGANEFFEQAL
jgi:hypothetical protein